MHPLFSLAGAAIFTYFVSRITLRIPLGLRLGQTLVAAHAIAFAAIAVLIVTWRTEAGVFAPQQLLYCVAMQLFWIIYDGLRRTARRASTSVG